MDYATLKALKPWEFAEAADGYQSVSAMADHAYGSAEGQITTRLRAGLSGVAVDAALEQLRGLAKNFHYTQVECGLAATSLNALAASFTEAKRKLDAAVGDAEAQKFSVGADGSVSFPPGGTEKDGKLPEGGTVSGSAKGKPSGNVIDPTKDANDLSAALERQAANIHPNPNFGKAVEIANRIAQAVAEATEADTQWAPGLRKLKADDDLVVSDSDWADVQGDTADVSSGAKDYLSHIKPPPPKGSDPRLNAEWWKGLSEEEREAYITLQPASIGALDGLPADVRDSANRTVLAETHGAYQTELNGIPKEPQPKYHYVQHGRAWMREETDEWSAWSDKYADRKAHLKDRLQGMDVIQKRFDETGNRGLPDAYLLGFDAEANHDGRVILANGNPDTADHTAIFVPGTKTTLGSIEDEAAKSDALWRETSLRTPGQSVSTITWFDYDAPDTIPQATHDQYAEKGAPTLRRFLDGTEAAHQSAGGDGHTTLIGHSYGTTLIGDTAKYRSPYADTWWSDPLPVDDVIAIGSPGMQADHAADLGFKPKHTWAMEGGGDDNFVTGGGRLMGLGDNGIIPTDETFGANKMKSDSPGHGNFWDEENGEPSQSLLNQALVIAGQYEDVDLERKAG
ncbi:alpha/beta hydrolase [Streptomyces sp. NBC_00503]|uniref:alpha/beta hydrolase n=1 Tax=Streptomyces sp. NBC_00503 TaxID=2903659 RepID=UPI002E801A9A|nr:alpha/beta hydrolase [Streptomyces sp. NBC_00503]WUD83398.1 alpha/beta hydrolase family protein [Streptomyces sp. NBC_00503]